MQKYLKPPPLLLQPHYLPTPYLPTPYLPPPSSTMQRSTKCSKTPRPHSTLPRPHHNKDNPHHHQQHQNHQLQHQHSRLSQPPGTVPSMTCDVTSAADNRVTNSQLTSGLQVVGALLLSIKRQHRLNHITKTLNN